MFTDQREYRVRIIFIRTVTQVVSARTETEAKIRALDAYDDRSYSGALDGSDSLGDRVWIAAFTEAELETT